MRLKLQFAGWLVSLGMSLALVASSFAQAQGGNGAQNRPANRPPARQSQPPRQQPPRQQQRQEQSQQRRQPQQPPRAQNERQNSGGNRPPNASVNRAGMMGQPNVNPNRPSSAYTPPPRKFNQLSPQEQKKVVENYDRQKKLTPPQRDEINKRIENWNKLTPEQKSHVRNDLTPKWNQMPKARQDAIQHRLEVLQNMPEFARNQHLNDPNFTRGMSEEDKAMLHDLSHMHMGAPDPPKE